MRRAFLTLAAAASSALAQSPPSQLELNGYRLGQHAWSVQQALGDPWQVQTFPDGWRYRIQVLDRERNAYMVFRFSGDRPDHVFALQVAGMPGTGMLPFLGLVLGDPREKVDRVLGRPSRIVRNAEVGVDLLEYADRNYTVEVDTLGRLSSIAVFGYDGLDTERHPAPDDLVPRLRRAAATRDADSVLALLSPDLRVMAPDSTHGWTAAPRREVTGGSTTLARTLFAADGALRRALAVPPAAVTRGSRQDLGEVVVVRWTGQPVRELVFAQDAVDWQLAELVLEGASPHEPSSWDRYRRATLAALRGRVAQVMGPADGVQGTTQIYPGTDPMPSVVDLEATGETRPVSPAHLAMIDGWLRTLGLDPAIAALYREEWRFREGDADHWIPMQEETLATMRPLLRPGLPVRVWTQFAGAIRTGQDVDWVFLAFKTRTFEDPQD